MKFTQIFLYLRTKPFVMKKHIVFMPLVMAVLMLISSCTLHPSAPEGCVRHNSEFFKYMIDYPQDLCDVSSESDNKYQLLTIHDKNDIFNIYVLAKKASEEKIFDMDFFEQADTMHYTVLGEATSEKINLFNDRIERTYEMGDSVEMLATSIYGGQTMYILYASYRPQGKEAVLAITDTFRTSMGRGPLNTIRHKIYSIFGTGMIVSVACYVLFSFGITVLFFYILSPCFKVDSLVYMIVTGFIALTIYAYVVVTDEFMGYLYGHNNIITLLGGFIMVFIDSD